MFFEMISILIIVLMSASIDCQSNDSICDFFLKDGRVRDIGIYQYLYQNSSRVSKVKSYRLFQRGTSNEEYEIAIDNRTVLAIGRLQSEFGILHKFYAGYNSYDDILINCRVQKKVCPL